MVELAWCRRTTWSSSPDPAPANLLIVILSSPEIKRHKRITFWLKISKKYFPFKTEIF